MTSRADPSSPSRSTGPQRRLLAIREVAGETGIAVETLRVWERRYGRPEPVRLPSGHRRYPESAVQWLRRVAQALALGHRAGDVLPASDAELDALLRDAGHEEAPPAEVESILAAVVRFDASDTGRLLDRAVAHHGPRRVLDEVVTPLLVEVGRRWATGELTVAHEHFATELVEDLLRGLIGASAARADGPALLVTTLPGEQHAMGAHMAALVCRLRGRVVWRLGVDTPVESIADAVRETGARAVLLSVSASNAGPGVDRLLRELRAAVDAAVPIVVGGAGVRTRRRGPQGIRWTPTLEDLEGWLDATGPGGDA